MEQRDRDLLISVSERLKQVAKIVDAIEKEVVPRVEVEKEVKRLDEKINARTKVVGWITTVTLTVIGLFTTYFASNSGSSGS